MSTFIMLTKVSHQGMQTANDLESLEKHVMDQVRAKCPEVKWQHSYAVLGPYDYLDVFEAQDVGAASKVSTLVRTMGNAEVQIWPATSWSQFKDMIHTLP